MFKTMLGVEGMSCGMCEAHVNDAVRKAFPAAKKVSSSRMKKLTEVISEVAPDTDALRRAIDATGYRVTGCKVEPFEKKRFLLFR